MKTFYAVIGGLYGDGEDTVLTFAAETKEDAIQQYRDAVPVIWGLTDEELATHEASGEGIFINIVLVSSAPIHEV